MSNPKWTSKRCSTCDVDWPHTNEYRNCPLCERETWLSDTEPVGFSEAKKLIAERRESLAKHEEFERRYADIEAERMAEGLDTWLDSLLC